MTEKQFKVTNISENGNTGLFWLGKDNLSVYDIACLLNEFAEENEELQSELSRYKEVNRLDVWKSSYNSEDALITELQNKCDKKQEHIVVLENKIRRMREAIHKLEWLASHRNADLQRENEQLKKENQELREYLGWQDMELEEMEDLND